MTTFFHEMQSYLSLIYLILGAFPLPSAWRQSWPLFDPIAVFEIYNSVRATIFRCILQYYKLNLFLILCTTILATRGATLNSCLLCRLRANPKYRLLFSTSITYYNNSTVVIVIVAHQQRRSTYVNINKK